MGADSRAKPDSPSRSASAWHAGIVALGAAGVLGFFARPLFRGEVYTASDFGNLYLPIRDFYGRALAAGHGVTWFPNEFTGFYLHGEGQAGLLHPLNVAQYRWLALEPAFNLELLRGYVLLFGGSYLLLRRLALARDASLFGAFLAAFSSFTFLHVMHLNIVGAAAHLPWLLLAMLAMGWPRTRAGGLVGLASVVLLTASLCMLGHPQFVFLVTAVEGFALLCALAGTPARAGRLALRFPVARALGFPVATALRFALAKALGFAAAGVALLPIWESLGTSFRAAPPVGFTSDFNIAPLGLVQLVAPYLFAGRAPNENLTEYGFYLGAVPTVLACYALIRGEALAHFRLARAAFALAAVALWLSLGNWAGLYRLQAWLPVVGLFRAPARYVLVVELAVALVAALAFADLARRGETLARLSRRSVAMLFLPAAIGLLVVACAPLLASVATPPHGAITSSWLLSAVGPTALGLAALLVLAASRGARLALPLLLVLAIVDIGAYGLSFVARQGPETVAAFLSRYRVPEKPSVDRLHWGPPALMMKGFRLAGGYAAMTPDRALDLGPFGEPLREIDARLEHVLRVSGVRWAIGTRIPEPLPRARLVTQVEVSDDPNADIAAIDVATTALTREPIALDAGPPGQVEIAIDVPGAIELATTAPGRQLLVVSERHHEGWRAEVDGAPTPVYPVYGDYLACVVGPGRQRVTFHFEPSSLRHGGWLSVGALTATAVWIAAAAVATRPRNPRRNRSELDLIDKLS